MKRRQPVYFFITVLLLLTTVFSVMFAIAPHKDACAHAACENCVELETAEKVLNAAIEGHADCAESNCDACVFIEIQREVVQKKRSAEHICHVLACDSCIRTAIGKNIKAVMCALAVFALAGAVYRAARYLLDEKNVFFKAFTLLAWKVRLNN